MQKTLLQKLNSALSKVNGNTMLIEDRGYDEYFCKCCNSRVYEDSYNHLKSQCYKCWYGEGNC